MKKVLIFSLIALFGVASMALAANAPNVGNTTQKGSVLVFPKIDISGEKDTLISISNDFYKPVNIKCYWVDDEQWIADFQFILTHDQPIMFSAKNGRSAKKEPIPITVPPFDITDQEDFDSEVGELKCWAVDDAGANQINWNHLYGTAKIIDYKDRTAFEYNSWNFAARSGSMGQPVGAAGNIKLDAAEFDACPQYLLFNFNTVNSGWGFFKDTDLTIVPCKQDLTQDRKGTATKVKYDIWNENETKFTAGFSCFKCWFEKFLSEISPKFKVGTLGTTAGRFRVIPQNPLICPAFPLGPNGQPANRVITPVIGLSSELLDFGYGKFAVAGTTANSAGIDRTGFILWDLNNPGGVVPESPGR